MQYISCPSKASMLQKKSAAHQETIKLFNQNEKFLYFFFLFGTILAFLTWSNPEAIRIQIRNTAFLKTLLGGWLYLRLLVPTFQFFLIFIFKTLKPSASKTTRNINWSSKVVEITIVPHTMPVPCKRCKLKTSGRKKTIAKEVRCNEYSTRSQATTINKDNEWDWHRKTKPIRASGSKIRGPEQAHRQRPQGSTQKPFT